VALVACTQLSGWKASCGHTLDDHRYWCWHPVAALQIRIVVQYCGIADVQITLIDQNEQFVFKPLLYELINGGATPEEVAPMFADLLAPMNSTSFVQARNHA